MTCVIVFNISLDEILGGGLFSGELTEIFGSPGVGKTQVNIHTYITPLLMQLFLIINHTIHLFLFIIY